MTRTRRWFLGTVTVTAGLGLAGCSGDDDSDGGGADGGGADGSDGGMGGSGETDGGETDDGTDDGMGGDEATVAVSAHSDHGDILVGPEGMTLYNFDSDEQGAGASTCDGGCADAWPPLTVESADDVTAGENVSAELSTFEREDGSIQVAANGWPLYYYASDESPGDTAGQGANDVWWVMNPAGEPQRDVQPSVTVASTDAHGDILVGPEGMTLYNFDSDEQGAGESACSGGCAQSWPPLTVESADDVAAGENVTAELSTFERDDGSIQVAANGWPLYFYASDDTPGDTTGQGVNDAWWVMSPAGEPIRGGDEGGLAGDDGGSDGGSSGSGGGLGGY